MISSAYQELSTIPGAVGDIEVIITPPAKETTRAVGIICHPHPLYGGTMHNKVVTTVARVFFELGMWSMRFNFRGVGKSMGHFANGEGETEDLLAVIQWVRTHFSGYNISLAGFSFGAYVALAGALQEPEIRQLITIAPAVNHADFPLNADIHCPWILVMGEADEIVPLQAVKTWAEKQPAITECIYFPGVSHFFHGSLALLREQLKTALSRLI